MQKINCPECGKQFIWTDDHPPRGKCPNDGCEWQYDIRKEIDKGLAKRLNTISKATFPCPECGSVLSSSWACCSACGTLVLASRPLNRWHLVFISILALVLLSIVYNYYY